MNFEKLSKLLQGCKNPYTSPYTENVFVIHDWYMAMTGILARAALKHRIRNPESGNGNGNRNGNRNGKGIRNQISMIEN